MQNHLHVDTVAVLVLLSSVLYCVFNGHHFQFLTNSFFTDCLLRTTRVNAFCGASSINVSTRVYWAQREL